MSWEVNDKEFENVLALPAARRYEYFIKRSASHGQLWGLHGYGGSVMAEDDDGNTHFPVWPHPRFAKACSTGPWESEDPQAIDVDEWIEGWIPQLQKRGIPDGGLFRRPRTRESGSPRKDSSAISRRSFHSSSCDWHPLSA